MKTAEYYLLDVFTDRPFTGNPLAVFPNADGLTTTTMQAFANELNLAETVFLGAATNTNHYTMRIFTPTEELPFAGHPTVGTAHLLAELNRVNPEQTLVLQPPIGELAVSYAQGRATFTTAQPAEVIDSNLDRTSAAALLGLETHQVIGKPVIASCGLPYHLIELADMAALESVIISATTWADYIAGSSAGQIYLYLTEQPNVTEAGTETETETVLRSRMFCMHASICEDPATGSAAAALTGYLVANQPNALRWKIYQGVEMGRPSLIYTAANGDVKPGLVQVGGQAIIVGEGKLYYAD